MIVNQWQLCLDYPHSDLKLLIEVVERVAIGNSLIQFR